ncbi:MAG: tetratricopeptide repeat protein [Candidatus Omnitrophica bacterium]|nr:tetratricopeptide repeat protein [Candidatus Omnitrophota bacterium]
MTRRFTGRAAAGLATAVTAFLCAAPCAAQPAGEMREVKVGVAVAPGFKSVPGWKNEFERRLAYASRIFETEFKIRLRPSAYWNWHPEESGETRKLLEDLSERFPLDGADLVVGLTRLTVMPEPERIKDLHVIGQARPFGGYVLIRYPASKLFKIQQETVLVHEIGHVFGAVHTGNRTSIMSPVVERQIPSVFDEANRQIIRLTRRMDFHKGVETLEAAALQQLLGAYLKLALQDQSAGFYQALGLFYVRLGQYDEALQAWREAVLLDETDPLAHLDLGILYFKTGRKDEAVKSLSRAASLFTGESGKKNKARALKILGRCYLEKNNPLSAYDALRRAKTLTPQDQEIDVYLAYIQVQRGQAQDAVRTLSRVLRKNPDDVTALSTLGYAQSEAGRPREALEALERALSLLKSNGSSEIAQKIEIYNRIGNVYMKINDRDRALAHFQEACGLSTGPECHKKLGRVYFQSGRWEDSIREFSRVLQEEKEDPEVYGLLGVAFNRKGDQENALGVFREGLRYARDRQTEARFHKNIGHVLLSANHYDLALKEFQLAASKDWSNEAVHLGLAMAYLGKSQFLSARESLTTVLRLNPMNAKAKEMLARLEKGLEEQQAL